MRKTNAFAAPAENAAHVTASVPPPRVRVKPAPGPRGVLPIRGREIAEGTTGREATGPATRGLAASGADLAMPGPVLGNRVGAGLETTGLGSLDLATTGAAVVPVTVGLPADENASGTMVLAGTAPSVRDRSGPGLRARPHQREVGPVAMGTRPSAEDGPTALDAVGLIRAGGAKGATAMVGVGMPGTRGAATPESNAPLRMDGASGLRSRRVHRTHRRSGSTRVGLTVRSVADRCSRRSADLPRNG